MSDHVLGRRYPLICCGWIGRLTGEPWTGAEVVVPPVVGGNLGLRLADSEFCGHSNSDRAFKKSLRCIGATPPSRSISKDDTLPVSTAAQCGNEKLNTSLPAAIATYCTPSMA